MALESEVARWFDGQAPAYDAWDRWPWSYWREREAAAVMYALGGVVGVEVLELGGGSGRFTRRLLAAGARRVVVVDIAPGMLARLPRTGVEPVCADAAAVRLDRTFPVVLAAGMLEFVPDAAAVLANAARHAAPGARLVLLLPRPSVGGRLYRRWHGRHGLGVRLFPAGEVEALAHATGWRLGAIAAAPPFSWVARLERC